VVLGAAIGTPDRLRAPLTVIEYCDPAVSGADGVKVTAEVAVSLAIVPGTASPSASRRVITAEPGWIRLSNTTRTWVLVGTDRALSPGDTEATVGFASGEVLNTGSTK